jgi:hypothetical protein
MTTSEHTITPADVEGADVKNQDVLHDLYADWSQIMAATPDLTIRLQRSLFDEWHQPTVEPQGVTYREDTVGGVPGIWCLPEGADTSKVLLYTTAADSPSARLPATASRCPRRQGAGPSASC